MRIFFCTLFLISIILVTSCGGRQKQKSNTLSDTTKASIMELSAQINKDASNPDLYNRRARLYLLDHQFDKALKDINLATGLAPDKPEYYISLSDIYLLMGQTKNSQEALQKALSLDPRSNEVLLRLAKLSLIIRDYPATFDYIKKITDLDPINPKAYFIRGIALLEKGDTLRAVDDLKKAVDQDQQFFDAYLELGELYAMKKDRIAADYFKNALNIHPRSTEALYLLGMYYQETGQYDKAIDTYGMLSRIDSTYRNAPYNSGYIYLVYLKNFTLAAKYFSDAIQRDPGYVDAYFNRGFAYELAHEYMKAYQDYQKVLKLKTNYQKAIDGLNRLDMIAKRKK